MNKLKVALAQFPLSWENNNENLDFFTRALSEVQLDCDLIVLPEMFNTGFTMNARSVAQKMDGQAVGWITEMSLEYHSAICGSLVIEEKGNYYNRFIWAEDGKILRTYDKRHLFRMADEHLTYSLGKERTRLNFREWNIMPRVCYDLRFPVWNRSSNVDLQIYVANWPAPRVSAWDKLLLARAIENQCYVLGVNRIGKDENGIEYSGHSIVVDPYGNPLTETDNEKSGWIYAELDKTDLNRFREKFPLALDADSFEIQF